MKSFNQMPLPDRLMVVASVVGVVSTGILGMNKASSPDEAQTCNTQTVDQDFITTADSLMEQANAKGNAVLLGQTMMQQYNSKVAQANSVDSRTQVTLCAGQESRRVTTITVTPPPGA